MGVDETRGDRPDLATRVNDLESKFEALVRYMGEMGEPIQFQKVPRDTWIVKPDFSHCERKSDPETRAEPY